MTDKRLHWQACLGAVKLPALLIGIIAVLGLGMWRVDFENSLAGMSGAKNVSLAQLSQQTFQRDQYIQVTGVALYDRAVKPSAGSFIYPLVDERLGVVLWVRSAEPRRDAQKSKPQKVVLTGMLGQMQPATHKSLATPPLILAGADAIVITTMELNADQKPPSVWITLPVAALLGLTMALSIVALGCPATVFDPAPIEPASIFETGEPGVRVAGRLQRLCHLEPWIEFADAARHFRPAVAQLLRLENRHLLVLVNFTPRSRAPTTQWGVLIEPDHLVKIEPGKLYGWRDRWAVRIEYQDAARLARQLVISFNHSGAQAEFVARLRQMGYRISEPWSEKV